MEIQELKTWVKNSLEKLDNELRINIKKCLKQEHACVLYFPNHKVSAIKR